MDEGYASDARKCAAEAASVLCAVKEKAKPGRRLTARRRTPQSPVRQDTYRGLAKNAVQVYLLLALANLHLARRRLASA